MVVYLGADHRGFKLKNYLYDLLIQKNYQVVDCGNSVYDKKDDYPDFAGKVASEVSKHPDKERGIVVCGSGVGVAVVANKYKGIRCGIAINTDQVKHARENDAINVLSLASDYTSEKKAKEFVFVFLSTPFLEKPRLVRRIKKVEKIEQQLTHLS